MGGRGKIREAEKIELAKTPDVPGLRRWKNQTRQTLLFGYGRDAVVVWFNLTIRQIVMLVFGTW